MLRRTLLLLTLTTAANAQLQAQTEPQPTRYLIAYRTAQIPGDAESRATHLGAHILRRHERLGIALATSTNPAALAALPNVEFVIPDRLLTAHSITVVTNPPIQTTPIAPYDGLYNSPQSWAIRQVGGFGANIPGGPAHGPWDTTQGKSIRIAILDSGIDATHPDLAPNLALNLSEIDPSALPSPCDDGSPQDQTGHGTWTASLAAAAAGPGTGALIGVAPQATLLNIKVLERLPADGVNASTCATGQASGLLSWLLQGIDDALANHADILSLSLGTLADLNTAEGAGLLATFNRVTAAAAQSGAILIAAAGNDGLNLASSHYIELPAQSKGVLAILASTNPACAEDLRANASTCVPGSITRPYYSNYGIPAALAAPGGSYPSGPDSNPTLPTGWILGACSSGLPHTTDAATLATDSTHSYGCFGLGHTPYVQAMGTSASAPLAAGAAALLWSAHPTWSAAQVLTALQQSATTIPTLPATQISATQALATAKP